MKLYGRIEELCTVAGAKIPLKMQAMTPIRDASLDAGPASKRTGMPGRVTWFTPQPGQEHFLSLEPSRAQAGKLQSEQLSAQAQKTQTGAELRQQQRQEAQEPAYPPDYLGSWSGELTVYLVDFDSSYFDFDPAEAGKQQELLKTGKKGTCTVTFYPTAGNKIEMQPTQVVFSAPLSTALQELNQVNPALSALAGSVGITGNSMLANSMVPEFALPLGNLSSGQGVTGNQLSGELMKNTLKDVGGGVLEQQIVTRESIARKDGRMKTSFSESDLRFTRTGASSLYLEAASVGYDAQGKYLNKVILTGTLERGNGTGTSTPAVINVFGAPANNPALSGNPAGQPAELNLPGNLNPFGNLSPPGNLNQPGNLNPFGNLSPFGNTPLTGSPGSQDAGSASKLIEQMQQVDKLLKELIAQ